MISAAMNVEARRLMGLGVFLIENASIFAMVHVVLSVMMTKIVSQDNIANISNAQD